MFDAAFGTAPLAVRGTGARTTIGGCLCLPLPFGVWAVQVHPQRWAIERRMYINSTYI